MTQWHYTKGLHDLGNQVYAYLLPDGSWGWSNAGLIVGGDRSLLVDTLFDLRLTQDMLDTMRAAIPAAASIKTLVNTHANGDALPEFVAGHDDCPVRRCVRGDGRGHIVLAASVAAHRG